MITSRFRLVFGAGVLFLALGGTALAETAEEAVAYAFMGLADGATFQRATTRMNWTESSTSPAIFDGDVDIEGKVAKVTFTVTAIDPCHYDIALEGPMVPGGGKALYAKVDLTAVTGARIAPDAIRIEIDGDGFCETGRTNRDCMKVDRSDLFGTVEETRHAETLAFIKASVCPAGTE